MNFSICKVLENNEKIFIENSVKYIIMNYSIYKVLENNDRIFIENVVEVHFN